MNIIKTRFPYCHNIQLISANTGVKSTYILDPEYHAIIKQ